MYFGVSRKFLRFKLYRKEIDLDLAKANAFKPLNLHDLQITEEFYREGILCSQIYSCSAWAPQGVTQVVDKNVPFKWNEEQQKAFQMVKDVLSSPNNDLLMRRVCLLLSI